jgi:hypothetical protein
MSELEQLPAGAKPAKEKMEFSQRLIRVSMTGEQWFSLLVSNVYGKAALSKSGRKVLESALDDIKSVVERESAA